MKAIREKGSSQDGVHRTSVLFFFPSTSRKGKYMDISRAIEECTKRY